MAFTISEKTVTAGGVETTALVMEESHGLAYAEVWPSYGFNCLRWKVRNSAWQRPPACRRFWRAPWAC